MTRNVACRMVVFASAVLMIFAGCSQRRTGPWDMQTLKSPPAFQWADKAGMIKSLYYTGEPFNGQPTRVFAYYAAPEGVKGKVPGMVLVHGGGGKAFPEWVELWNKRGYAAIAMDLAGHGPDGVRLPDGGPDQGHIEKFQAINKGIKNTWSYHAVAAVIRAHSLLRSFPEVDVKRTGVTGISWGGYLTCIVAGVDDRFKVAVPVYGCGFLHDNSAWLNIFAQLPQEDKKVWIEQFDPSKYLAGCRMPILFMNGTNDFAYPLDSYQKSYRLVPERLRNISVTIRMPHSHPDGWAPKEIGIFVDSILKGSQPLARFGSVTVRDRQVNARIQGIVPIKEASLHYTTDTCSWKDRQWQTIPAEITKDGQLIQTTLPAKTPCVYFLTARDERDAVVSTEHAEFK